MIRFSIRDLLWLTVVVALLCLVWQLRTERAKLLEAEEQRLKAEHHAQLIFAATRWFEQVAAQDDKPADRVVDPLPADGACR